MKKPKPIIAKSHSEWWSIMRKELSKWNSSNHPEDNLTLLDWVGEHVGSGDTFGYRVIENDRTESGFDLEPLHGQPDEWEDDPY